MRPRRSGSSCASVQTLKVQDGNAERDGDDGRVYEVDPERGTSREIGTVTPKSDSGRIRIISDAVDGALGAVERTVGAVVDVALNPKK